MALTGNFINGERYCPQQREFLSNKNFLIVDFFGFQQLRSLLKKIRRKDRADSGRAQPHKRGELSGGGGGCGQVQSCWSGQLLMDNRVHGHFLPCVLMTLGCDGCMAEWSQDAKGTGQAVTIG